MAVSSARTYMLLAVFPTNIYLSLTVLGDVSMVGYVNHSKRRSWNTDTLQARVYS